MDGWGYKPIGELCEILDYMRKPVTKRDRIVGPYPYYGATGILDYVNDYIFDEPLVLIGEDGAKWDSGATTAYAISGKCWVNNHAHVLRPFRDIILDKWLIYYLNHTDLREYTSGLTVPKLNQKNLRIIPVLVPPLSEQQRTVAILDEAFKGINSAKANAEINLQNARELFEGYLQNIKAEKAALGDHVHIRTGKLDANAAVEGGKYPFFTCSRSVFAIDKYAFDCEAILLAGNNAVGDFNVKHYKGKFNAYQRTYVITAKNEKSLNYRFLYYQLLKSLKQFKSQSVGTGTKFLKIGIIQLLQISMPDIKEQEIMANKLDAFQSEIQKLESLNYNKLAVLDELKKSLLNQAFTGNL